MGDTIESSAEVVASGSLKSLPTGQPVRESRTKSEGGSAVLHQVFLDFREAMQNYEQVSAMAEPALKSSHLAQLKAITKQLTKFQPNSIDDSGAVFEIKDAHNVAQLLSTIRELKRAESFRPLPVLRRSLFMGIFSEYDSFVGSLLKAIYIEQPQLFKSIRREIVLADLLEFESLEAVKMDMLDKEIDSFRRESYVDQFCQLEKKFNISSLRKFPEWPMFVEIGQRRNILTHNGGIVSEQYLIVCEREGVTFAKRPAVGEKLPLNHEYLLRAIEVLSKVGLMLVHTLWRKVIPSQTDEQISALNDSIYDLLLNQRWKEAADLAQFGLSEPMLREVPDLQKRIRTANSAIAYKFSGDQKRCNQILDSLDWSACIRDFKLAVAVLKDDFLEAKKLMKEIGKKGELVGEVNYHEWPLFHEFRNRTEFHETYLEIYGKAFVARVDETSADKSASTLTQAATPKARSKNTRNVPKVKANDPTTKTKPTLRIGRPKTRAKNKPSS